MNDIISYMVLPGMRTKVLINGRRGQSEFIERIIDKTCEFYGQTRKDVESRKRYRPIVVCRQICVYLLKKYTNLTWEAMGNLMGGRDHTTCIHSVETIKDLMFSDPNFIRDINAIETLIF